MAGPTPIAILRITSFQIITGRGPDKISGLVDGYHAATWPYDEPLTVDFECSAGRGALYLSTYFPGVPVEVIDTNTSRPKFTSEPPAAHREAAETAKGARADLVTVPVDDNGVEYTVLRAQSDARSSGVVEEEAWREHLRRK